MEYSNLPAAFCGNPAFHGRHAYRNMDERVVKGVAIQVGDMMFCHGKHPATHTAAEQTAMLPMLLDAPTGDLRAPRAAERAARTLPPRPALHPMMDEMQYDLSQTPIFGIRDDTGRSLMEFRLNADGTIDAKYYPEDLTPACIKFVENLLRMAGRNRADNGTQDKG